MPRPSLTKAYTLYKSVGSLLYAPIALFSCLHNYDVGDSS